MQHALCTGQNGRPASAAGLASRARGLQDRSPGHQQSDPWRAGRVWGGDGAQRSRLAAGAGGYRDSPRPALHVALASRPTRFPLPPPSLAISLFRPTSPLPPPPFPSLLSLPPFNLLPSPLPPSFFLLFFHSPSF